MRLGAPRIVTRTRPDLTLFRAAQSRHALDRRAVLVWQLFGSDHAACERTAPLVAARLRVASQDLGASRVGLGGGTLREIAAAGSVAQGFGQGDATDPAQ